jgi:hypothetical protein
MERYDFVIVDGLYRCLVVVPHRLGVPFALLSNIGDYDRTAFALQGGYIAPTIADFEYKNSVTLFDKIKKVVGLSLLRHVMTIDAKLYSPEAPFTTVHDIADRASIFFLDNSLVFDHQVPLSRNVINVGGLTTKPPRILPNGELKAFLDSADNGFILVSFGSLLEAYPSHIADLFMVAFGRLPYKVVWKYDRGQLPKNTGVSRNILLLDWLPQHDILGHENIKLFITHGGSKGQHEALYNAVPMLGIPIAGDHLYNTERIQCKGLGRRINLGEMNVSNFIEGIDEVINNSKYKEAMTKASGLFHDDVMTPGQRLVHWVEHVIKYGDQHLISYTNNLSFIQILMLDVIFVIFMAILSVCSVIFFIAKIIIKDIIIRKAIKPKQS